MERLQELGDGDAADAVAGAAGTVPEGAREEGLPHADGTAEDDVLLLGQPVQAEELADAGAIGADRAVPHDLLEGGGLLEARLLQPQGEAMGVAAVDLVLEQELQELDLAQLPLARMGDAIGQRREQAAQAQPFQSADEIKHHLEGERPGAGRIDPVGAVALGEPQEFLRLPQTRPGNVPRSSTVMNWPPAGPSRWA
jgi:hypothetical protein